MKSRDEKNQANRSILASHRIAKWLKPNSFDNEHLAAVKKLREKFTPDQLLDLKKEIDLISATPSLNFQSIKLRQAGASSLQLLRFLSAKSSDKTIEESAPSRQECYQQTIVSCAKRQEKRIAHSALLAGAPIAFLGGMTAFGVFSIMAAGSLVEPEAGVVALDMASSIWGITKDLADPSPIGAALSTVAGYLGWNAAITPNTIPEDTLRIPETEILGSNTTALSALSEITGPERFLIQHLTGFELKEFLLGGTQERIQILRESPPSAGAEMQYLLAKHPKNIKGISELCAGIIHMADHRFLPERNGREKPHFHALIEKRRSENIKISPDIFQNIKQPNLG